MMRNRSIITKIVVSVGGTVFLALLAGGLVVISQEIKLFDGLTDQYERQFIQAIDEREEREKEKLRKNVRFNANMFSKVVAGHLYRYSLEHLEIDLYSYMEYPEILAVQILDEEGNPLMAAWKDPAITTADQLPDSFQTDPPLSIRLDCIFDEMNIGSFHLYYTESILIEDILATRAQTRAMQQALHEETRSQMMQMIAIQSGSGIGLFVVLVVSQIFALKMLILKPILHILTVTQRLSEFDLTVSVPQKTRDEIGRMFAALNDTLSSFRNIVGQVQKTGAQVSASAMQLASSSKQQEVTVKNQVESTFNVQHLVEEISSIASELVATMKQAASRLHDTVEFASSGRENLSRMDEVIHHMTTASQSISGKLGAINEKAENITTVVTTINKVAEQTNLLSLNASIEAEKAGEYGRGFTVVAREIRRLADQTAVATLDIEQMVREMQTAVSSGVMEMDKFMAEVRDGAENVERINAQLSRIIEEVQALSPHFEEINTAMGHQSESASKINSAMIRLSEEMLLTRDSLQESYASVEALSQGANDLRKEVSRFKV